MKKYFHIYHALQSFMKYFITKHERGSKGHRIKYNKVKGEVLYLVKVISMPCGHVSTTNGMLCHIKES
jgi:hypothetical protein